MFEHQIAKHAREEMPREACGFVIKGVNGLEAVPSANIAFDPEFRFRISPEETLQQIQSGALVGYYHSHPQGGDASAADRHVAEAARLPLWIYDVPADILRVYVPNGYRTPLLGREFIPGVFDCVSLVWDYYAERGITLPELPRTQADYRNGTKLDWRPLMQQAGGELVQEPHEGDVLVMALYNATRPNHMGIYIGGNEFIHQTSDTVSRRQAWVGAWRRATVFIVRIPGL